MKVGCTTGFVLRLKNWILTKPIQTKKQKLNSFALPFVIYRAGI